MKVIFIDKNGNKAIKNIDVDFKKISITDMKNISKECTYLISMPKMDFTNNTEEKISEMWKNCKIQS